MRAYFQVQRSSIDSHAVSFKRPLLSVDVSVSMYVSFSVWLCLSVCVGNFGAKYLGKLSDFVVRIKQGAYIKVSTARASIGDVIDNVTWLYDS